MKVVIIVFSPSGHTLKVAEMIKNQCEKYKSSVKLVNITGKKEFLFDDNRKENLYNELGEYELLFIGGPIYAGHMERNILNAIEAIPNPDKEHVNHAVPFATYGGAHSSIALEEMGDLLKKKYYKSLLGIKIVAKHTLTETFSNIMNPNKPGKEEEEFVNKAVDQVYKIIEKKEQFIIDQSESFRYSPLNERNFFKLNSQEKLHNSYKNVGIIQDSCIKCGKCIHVCPVKMFYISNGKINMHTDNKRCILCAECFHNCPVNAIDYPYIEMVRKHLQDGNKPMEEELSAIYPRTLND